MQLRPLDARSVRLAAEWLARPENNRWLDFGRGVRIVTAPILTLMNKHDLHALRVYTPDDSDSPIGIVGLSEISAVHKTASLWYVLGDKRFGGRGYTVRAAAGMLALGFETLELRAVQAWAVEANAPSITVLQRTGFKLVGRQRKCHEIDGILHDRLLFDLLRAEYQPSSEWQHPTVTASNTSEIRTSASLPANA
jgi:RimJ/RimL family protein N-acetyltransferase